VLPVPTATNLASPSASGSSWCMAKGSRNTPSESAKDTTVLLQIGRGFYRVKFEARHFLYV
jgi:hypothetical protein